MQPLSKGAAGGSLSTASAVFKDALVYPERSKRFFTALCNELRSLGVVTVLSDETRSLDEIEMPEHGLTAMLDNVVSLRHVDAGAQRRKLISVVKMREGAGNPSAREFSIDARGFVVSSTVNSTEVSPARLRREPPTSRPKGMPQKGRKPKRSR